VLLAAADARGWAYDDGDSSDGVNTQELALVGKHDVRASAIEAHTKPAFGVDDLIALA